MCLLSPAADPQLVADATFLWKLIAGAASGIAIAITALWRRLASQSDQARQDWKDEKKRLQYEIERARTERREEFERLVEERDEALLRAERLSEARIDDLKSHSAEKALLLAMRRARGSEGQLRAVRLTELEKDLRDYVDSEPPTAVPALPKKSGGRSDR